MSQSIINPLQAAYQARKGVDDATATLLNLVVGYLGGLKIHAGLFHQLLTARNPVC